MKPTLTARQTEYKGVVYKSKCEAMFARYLELYMEADFSQIRLSRRGWYGCGFSYEPSKLTVGDYTPDFFWWEARPSDTSLPELHAVAVEYKPSVPTRTYIKEWASNCDAIVQRLTDLGFYTLSFSLYYGSIFNRDRGEIIYNCINKKTLRFAEDWLSPFEAAVRATRFDLEAQ